MQTVQTDLSGMVLEEYRVERLLGSGKLTAVYMGSHVAQEQQVMITTFLLPAGFSSQARERFRERFLHDSVVLTHLRHQHILPFYAAGEQYGYPYLVTPFVKENSLASVMNTHPRFKAEQVLVLVKQIADALDYAYSQGVLHGALIPSSVLLTEKQGVHIAGFGFTHLLSMQEIEQSDQPNAHLYNVVGTPLCPPAYMAPEWLRGAAVDVRTDVYALGVLLFQLLTGALPFPQVQSVETALQAIGQPIPSASALCPDVPAGLDLIVQRALESNPKQRFQSAGDLARAFERAMVVIAMANSVSTAKEAKKLPDTQVTLPPTVNWFDEEMVEQATHSGQPPMSLTGRQRAVPGKGQDGNWQLKPPIVTGQMPAVKAAQGKGTQEQVTGGIPVIDSDSMPSTDPFVWWSTVSLGQGEGQEPGTFRARTTTLRPTSALRKRRQPTLAERRRTLAILAGSGVAAVGILGLGGIGLAHFIEGHLHQQTATTLSPSTTATSAPTAQPSPTAKAAPTPKPTTKPSPTAQPTAQATSQPTTAPTNQPTQQPTPTPQPPTPTPTPSHTGTVIGSTSMGTNSSQNFTDPHNNSSGILIHLPNGNFVAYNRACTHQYVLVNYNSSNQKLDCPAHGAIFDPANNGQVLGGPAPRPLPSIQIMVNSDGTITV